jgi:hypothetical protein
VQEIENKERRRKRPNQLVLNNFKQKLSTVTVIIIIEFCFIVLKAIKA